MKITTVEPVVVHAGRCNWVFARIKTDEGIEGLGEGSLLGKARTIAAGIQDAAGYLIGQNPLNPERIWRLIYESDRYRGGPILTSVLSAIDMACWDILGKHLGAPVWQLLGGACRDKIRLYGRLSSSKSAEDRLAKNLKLVQDGYTAIKLSVEVPDDGSINESDLIHQSVAEFVQVREKVGSKVELLFDSHAMLSLPGMVQLRARHKALSPLFF